MSGKGKKAFKRLGKRVKELEKQYKALEKLAGGLADRVHEFETTSRAFEEQQHV